MDEVIFNIYSNFRKYFTNKKYLFIKIKIKFIYIFIKDNSS